MTIFFGGVKYKFQKDPFRWVKFEQILDYFQYWYSEVKALTFFLWEFIIPDCVPNTVLE